MTALCGLTLTPRLSAQLISPGRLTEAHADLEGIRNCGKCHELGRRGIANDRCLTCHTPLQRRLASKAGLHASFEEPSCNDCHKEHAGRDLDIVRFDTTGFDHQQTGFELRGAHRQTACRTCHTAERVADADVRGFKEQHGALGNTFLGLPATCTECHAKDNPHGKAFASTCQTCHREDHWAPAPGFDHGNTRFPLTGLHGQVACRSCHGEPATAAGYAVRRFEQCADCHRDPHAGRMGGSCRECHVTAGWPRINGARFAREFDHNSTGFALAGAHRQLECAFCHDARRRSPNVALRFGPDDRGRQYPTPAFATCTSCHVDYHAGTFDELPRPAGATCDACHSSAAWTPTGFDLARHNAETDFPLSGGHAPLPCAACHLDASTSPPTPRFAIFDQTCVACHAVDNPHGRQFDDRTCESCHVVAGFDQVTFDHTATRFPLDGAHIIVPCVSCHTATPQADGTSVRTYRGVPTECRSCHTS